MKILGIDPGSRKTGWALIDVNGKKISYIASGILKFDHVEEFIDRLGLIYKSCEELHVRLIPEEVAFESLIYVKSVEALSKLAQARGAMIAAFMKDYSGKVFEYSPNLVKSSVTGHGHASKESVEKAVQLMFGKISFKTADESDALAIAVCHALNRNMRMKISESLKEKRI
jgi:crossover junction endodeoxyribonuclease RuvC